jgi:hypothetical protein
MDISTFYEVHLANKGGAVCDEFSNFKFETPERAIEVARIKKTDPASVNKRLTSDEVKYWKSKSYTVVEITISVKEIATI